MHGPFTPQFSIMLPREEWMALPPGTETCPGHIMIMSHLPSVKKKKPSYEQVFFLHFP